MLNRDEELRFCKARRAAIALDFQNLNPEQRKAVGKRFGQARAGDVGMDEDD